VRNDLPLFGTDDHTEAFFHALLVYNDVSRCWPLGRIICEEEDKVMGGKATYWTSSEAGMSGVFSLGSI
jgi:hypothetical protein